MQGVPAPTGQTFTLIGCDIKDITGLTMSQGWTYTFIEGGANDLLLATAVPEPSTVMLLGLGLAGLVGLGIKRRAKK